MAQGPAVRKERVHLQGGGAEHQGPSEVPGNHGDPSGPPGVVKSEEQSLLGLGSNVGGRGTVLRLQIRGAQEAWWTTNIEMEYDKVLGNSTAVAFFDMAKCYHMIPRKLACEVPPQAGDTEKAPRGLGQLPGGPANLQHHRSRSGEGARENQVPAAGRLLV